VHLWFHLAALVCVIFFFFLDLNRNSQIFRKWCFKNALWCFCHLPKIKSVPFFSPKQSQNYIAWKYFCKSKAHKMCWTLQLWRMKCPVHTDGNSRLWKPPFLLQYCQGVPPTSGKGNLRGWESRSDEICLFISLVW